MATIDLSELSPAYAFLDPAGGKADLKRLAARSAIVVAATDSLGRVFVLSAWAERCTTVVLMAKMEETIERFAVKTIGVEEDGLVGLWSDALRVNCDLRGKRMPLMGVKQPRNQDKLFRIRTTLQPLISRGMLLLDMEDAGQQALHHEIVSFPMNPQKDMVDALASLVRYVIPPVVTKRETAMRDDQLLRYLRGRGVSPRQIEEVARQRHGGIR